MQNGKSSSLMSQTQEICIQIGIENMESTLRTLMARNRSFE